MSEAPASSGEADFGGPTEPEERFGMPAAFPPPQEKTDDGGKSGDDKHGVGGPNSTLEENGGAASADSLAKLAREGVGSAASEKTQDFSDERGEDTAENLAPSTESSDPIPEDNEIQTFEPISSGPKVEGVQERGKDLAVDRSESRSAKEDVQRGRTPGDNSSPNQEIVEPESKTPLEQTKTPRPLPEKLDSANQPETPQQTADRLFLGLRDGTEVFREEPGSPAWRANGKLVYQEGEASYQVFKQYGRSEERKVPISQLRQIADSRAGYDRPEPLQPPSLTHKPTRLEAQAHREAVREELGLEELQTKGATNKDKAKQTSKASTEDTTSEQQAPKIVRSSPTEETPIETPEKPSTKTEGSLTSAETVIYGNPKGTTIEVSQGILDLTQDLEEGKGPMVLTHEARSTLKKLGVTVAQLNTFEEQGDVMSALKPLLEAKHMGRLRLTKEDDTSDHMQGATTPPQESPRTSESTPSVEKELKHEEDKIAELTELQVRKINKLLNAKRPDKIKERFNIVGTQAALKEARKQLGIKRRVRDSEGNLNEKFIEELRKAQEEGRIREKAPEPKPEQPTAPEKPSFSQNLKEQVGRAQEKARDLGASGLATIERGRVAVVESLRTQAEKTGVGRFLFRQSEAFLNKVDWRDKEIVSWVAGMGFGAASTILVPIPGLSSILRAPLLVGLNLAGTKGLNALRLRSITNALKPYIVDKTTLKETAGKYDASFKLIRGDDKTAFNEEIARLSEEVSAGKPQDILVDAQTIATEALSIQMLQLSEKYANASNHIRSFAAGLSVGSIGGAILPELGLNIPGLGGGPEDASVSPEAPSPDVSFTEPLNSQVIPPEIAGTPNAAENWETFANHWNTLNVGQREDFLNIMSDPDQVASLEAWADAYSAIAPEFEPVQSILGSPENFTSLDIAQGDTVGALATENGYDNFWEANPDNAALKGLTIEENRALLEQATKSAANAGLATEAIPTEAELVELMNRAATGDLAANARLNEALHWIPEGGKLKLLNESVLSEAVKNLKLGS